MAEAFLLRKGSNNKSNFFADNMDFFDFHNAGTDRWKSQTSNEYFYSNNETGIVNNEGFITGSWFTFSNGSVNRNAYTLYTICKRNVYTDNWVSIINFSTKTPPQMNLCSHYGKFAIGSGSSYGSTTSGISALDFHCCAINFLYGIGCFYIDGRFILRYDGYTNPVSDSIGLDGESTFKTIAFFNNICHGESLIQQNSQLLMDKYNL